VRIVDTGGNLGFGRAATIGAFAQPAQYEYVAFLNPDARARGDWIERITEWMEREGVDVGSSVVSGGAQPFFAGGRWLAYLGAAVRLAMYAGERTEWVSGCAMVARRTAFETLGGFDPAYFLYYEDVDLSLRARSRGMRLGMHPDALVAHPEEGRSTNRFGSLRKRCFGLRSKGHLVRRFVPLPALPSALLFQCLVSPAFNGAGLREYPALVRAFLSGFCRKGPEQVQV
jgi:N-acetylglucosaminyl-diphospho-decaprenol L-rhamnosyltransferase